MNETIPPITGNAPQPKTSTLAIWSLVLSILGLVLLLVCIGPLFAIPGVICGHLAYSRIKRSSGALAGEGMALAGLITGYVSVGLSVFLLPMMLAIAIPNFVKARETAQMNTCINNLRMIDAAKQEWALENNKQSTDTPTQADLIHLKNNQYFKNGQFPTCLAGGVYTINPVGEAPTCSIPKHKVLPADL
jgi:competence protein ComGC